MTHQQPILPIQPHMNHIVMSSNRLESSPSGGFDTTTSYEKSRSMVSSVVVSEEFLGQLPQHDGVKYIEVPVVEEVVRHVPKSEIIEVEKRVPRYEYEYIDRIVEVPQIQYVDRTVEKPQIQEVVRTVPKKEYVDMPREVVRHVPKIETVIVEKHVEVPGQVIEVPKPYTVENKVSVNRYQDRETPVVVAQTVRPVIVSSNDIVDVDVYEYEPQVIPIDVHIGKPITSNLVSLGATSEYHCQIIVPPAQYNTILRSMNSHLGAEIDTLPYLREAGIIPFLSGHEIPGTFTAPSATAIQGYNVPIQTPSITTASGPVGYPQTAGNVTSRNIIGGLTGAIYNGSTIGYDNIISNYPNPSSMSIIGQKPQQGATVSSFGGSQIQPIISNNTQQNMTVSREVCETSSTSSRSSRRNNKSIHTQSRSKYSYKSISAAAVKKNKKACGC